MPELKQFNLGEAIGQGQQLAVNQFKLGEAARGVQARQGLTSALQDGTPEAMTQYSQQFPEESAAYQKTQGGLREEKIKETLLHFQVMGHLTAGVEAAQDKPAAYQQMLQTMNSAGMDTSQVPQNYDPNFMAQKKKEAMGIKAQLEDELKHSQIEENKGKAAYYRSASGPQSQGANGTIDLTKVDEATIRAAHVFNNTGKLPPNTGRGIQGPAESKYIRSVAAQIDKEAGVTPEFAAERQQNFSVRQKAEKDFATGKQGNSVRSFNVALEHLDTLSGLADALHNGNTQLINKIGNTVASQTGSAAPANFESAKKIVADEIVKAIVGAGGGVADRDEAAKTISSANSPSQLKGVIDTYKALMVGQLSGLHDQYKATTGNDDFEEKFLNKKAQDLYGKKKSQSAPTSSSGKSVGDYFK